MPELPEVFVVSKFLKKEAKGQTIEDIVVRYSKMMDESMRKKLIGQTINDIETHGKYLIFKLTDYDLISHLRMEGKYYVSDPDVINKHDHVIFYLTDKVLKYNDVRKFGTFDLREKSQTYKIPPLSKLAKEPFEIDLDTFYAAIKKRRSPIKTILLNQGIIAGIGNIYADEILFQAKIHPLKIANTLTKKQAQAIIASSIDILTRAIKKGGTTIFSFKSDEEVGWFTQDLMVHTRANEPCKICQTKIEKIKVNGRSTYFCSHCQRM